MSLWPSRHRLTPHWRVRVLAIVLALVGTVSALSLVTSGRFEFGLLALPVALGLLTRREFWRKVALGFALANALSTAAFLAFVATIAFTQRLSPPSAISNGWPALLIAVASATFIVAFTFTVLRQSEVKAIFVPPDSSSVPERPPA